MKKRNLFSYSRLLGFATLMVCGQAVVGQSASVDSQRADSDKAVEDFRKLKQTNLPQDAALDASVIVNILQEQPALALQIKKVLIKDALNQGRLLEEADLTDEVLFDLIRREQSIRIIATKEIVARHYLILRPTDEEVFRERIQQRQIANLEAADSTKQQKNGSVENAQPGTPQTAVSTPLAQGAVASSVGQNTSGSTSLPIVTPSELPDLFGGQSSRNGAAGGAEVAERGGAGAASIRSDITQEPLFPSEAAILSGADDSRSVSSGPSGVGISRESMSPDAYRHQADPYANVPSLIDLYQQATAITGELARFGSQVFKGDGGNFNKFPADLPVGPDYVIGPGDGLNIELWGAVSQRFQRVVDREGNLSLPEVGNVQVAGKTLAQVQQSLQMNLRAQFRNEQVDVSLARIRSVRVYVVGEVVNPGAYDVSSLSTPLNALIAAGGPTINGSFRSIMHYRGKNLIETVDLYDFLLHGVNGDIKRLESGDSIMVPPAHAAVSVEGMVRRPAQYELLQEKTLAEVLQLAGGVLPSGALRHIQVERIQAHQDRVMLSLDLPESDSPEQVTAALENFRVQDGDRIRVSPILPYVQKSVYLDGHVYRPGKYAYHDGMRISDLVHSYSDLLPEPSQLHAELIRLSAPEFRPTVIAFNVDEALKKDPNSDLLLQPLDTVRIFGRYDFEDPPEVVVSGAVRKPGPHRTNGDLRVDDAIYMAGGLSPDAMLTDAQIFRREHGTITVHSIDLESAMRGDTVNDLLLHPRDLLIVHRDQTKADPPSVMIEGEVGQPGKYPLGAGMTATQLVRLAGGFTRSAYPDLADLSRYSIKDGARVLGEHEQIELSKAFTSADADVVLRDGDTLTVRPIAGFSDIGATVSVKGAVMHPSVYGIKDGERLSSVLKRAGGFAPDSYPQGILLSRDSLRTMEEQNRIDLLSRLQAESASQQKYKPGTNAAEAALVSQSATLQEQQLIDRLKNEPSIGRLVVRISGDISKWQGTPDDIELRKGDGIFIPKRPMQVMVTGQVYSPTAITFIPGKNANWYLKQAGGASELANKKSIYIVRANGAIEGHSGTGVSFWREAILSEVLHPGDTLVVPERLLGGTPIFKTLLESAQIISSIAISAKAVGAF